MRRMGREDSKTREELMDAVETVMREDGYAALSARSVARAAGLNYQLVFYYFKTVDDLFLCTYKRRTDRMIKLYEKAFASETPLHAFWDMTSSPADGSLALEYMAMSNHNAAIRAESIRHSDRILEIVTGALSKRLSKELPDNDVFTPAAVGTLIVSIAGSLAFQHALGITGTTPEARALIEWCLDWLERPKP